MSSVFVVVAVLWTLGPDVPKLVVAPLTAEQGVTPGTARMLDEALLSHLRSKRASHVLSYGEVNTILSHEKLRQQVGCDTPTCFADLGGQLGASALVAGRVGQVGSRWIVALKLIDLNPGQVIASSVRRTASFDDVLDALPSAVEELVERSSFNWLKSVPIRALPIGEEIPAAFQETPYEVGEYLIGLQVATDGEGNYVAFSDKRGYEGPIFAGSDTAVFEQRIAGGSRNGITAWSAYFWDPRVRARWQASFHMKNGVYHLQCGESEVALEVLEADESDAYVKQVQFYQVRWQRQAHFIARDDLANYYFLDRALSPPGNQDYRLFVGSRGQARHVPLTDTIVDGGGALFVSAQGRLLLKEAGSQTTATWAVGSSQIALTPLDLYRQAAMVYTTLGAYGGQSLGTPCDPYLAP